MVEQPGGFFVREIRKAIDALLGCVAPLFHVTETGEPELLGSSVLIKISDSVLLCTAKHVLEAAQSSLHINGPSVLEVLTGEFYLSKQHDIAVLKLTSEQCITFKKYTPLSEDHIANHTQTETCDFVEFIGYPGTRNRANRIRHKFPNRLYSFGCTGLCITPEEVHFKFTKYNMDAKSRLRVRSPNPHGVSGGPIMGVSVRSESTLKGNPHPRLIGIATDSKEGTNEVFGPTSALLIATIKEGWHIPIPSRLDR
jgi:hypothetical protein